MPGILTRLLMIVGLLVGTAAHGQMAAAAIDGRPGAGMASMDAASCDMTKQGKVKPMDCAAICAVASADIVRGAPLRHPVVRPSWRLADLSADGLEPPPDPTPPRV